MTISQRIKYLRKNILNLTQDNFSEKIGLSRSNIANIEISRIKFTDRTIKDICREFNVNKEWLRYGSGEIFIENDSAFEQYLKENSATDNDIELIKCYLNLDLEIRNKIHEHFKCYFSNI